MLHLTRSLIVQIDLSTSPTCMPAPAMLSIIGLSSDLQHSNSLSACIFSTVRPLLLYSFTAFIMLLIMVSLFLLSVSSTVLNLKDLEMVCNSGIPLT